MKLNISYDFRPKKPSCRSAVVMDHFGVGFETGPHVIAEDLELPIQPGDLVCFTGASGSGKSSLMRAAKTELVKADQTVLDLDELELGDRVLIEALDGPVSEAMGILASCGLGEARLLLRTPNELSDGQRFRFRLALAVSKKPDWIVADEFSSSLDRTLAKVVAFNLRRLAEGSGIGFLLATTHEDILEDLAPSLHVRCRLDGRIDCRRSEETPASKPARKKKRQISFTPDIEITTGTPRDWPYFARWHYRSHKIGFPRFVTLLWHGDEPVGICVMTAPAVSLSRRNQFFGKPGKWAQAAMQSLNHQLVTLSRVVLHPTYRGAGLAAAFIRQSCLACPWPWIETLTQMGHINPVFEKAGFQRIGATKTARRSRRHHSALYGSGSKTHGKKPNLLSKETSEKSRHAEPIYYIFDNRRERGA